jgi:hypothetical protein
VELNNVKIYRITHLENIPHILKYGITGKDSPNKNPYYKNIGDISLIDTRSKKIVFIDNGDFASKNDLPSITLGDYIPFYFGVKMPMLYVAQHGGNFVEHSTHPSDIVYLVCSVINIVSSKTDFIFTDGHATDMLTSFYNATKVNDLTDIIDWKAIKAPFWGGNENLDIKRKKQAEFLVSDDLPPNQIVGIGCYNENAHNKLISLGIKEEKIKVSPNAYY